MYNFLRSELTIRINCLNGAVIRVIVAISRIDDVHSVCGIIRHRRMEAKFVLAEVDHVEHTQ